MARFQALTVTDAAAARVRALLAQRAEPVVGLRVGVKNRGCSGMSYTVEFAEEQGRFDEVIDLGDAKVLVDAKATMFLIGSEMDWVEDKLEARFVFRNPNEKGRCGCGESFHV